MDGNISKWGKFKFAVEPIAITNRFQSIYESKSLVRRAFKRIALPAQAMGVFPLSVNETVQISIPLAVFASSFQIAIAYFTVSRAVGILASDFAETDGQLDDDEAFDYSSEAGNLALILYTVSSTSSFCWHRRCLGDAVHRIFTCKTLADQLGRRVSVRPDWTPMWLHVPVVSAFVLEYCFARMTRVQLVDYCCEFLAGGILVFFVQLLLLVEGLLAHLNRQLLEVAGRLDCPGKYKKASVLADCHHHLSRTCGSVNSLHCFPLAILYFAIFVKMIVFIFKCVKMLSTGVGLNFAVSQLGLCCYVSRGWYLTHVCAKTADQAKTFDENLLEMILFDNAKENAYTRKLMLHLEMRTEVTFHARHLFVIDYSLLHSIAAVVTSYLVILVQTSGPQ